LQAGNGLWGNGPVDGARPWGPGSVTQPRETAAGKCDLNLPCKREREPHDHVTGRKGGRARRAVTLTLIVTVDREVVSSGETRRTRAGANAVNGGNTSKGRNTPRGSSFRDEEKRGEPHDRQQGETDLHGRGGESVEVVQNHVDGTRGGRQLTSEGQSGNARLGRRTPRLGTMEGRSLENPMRGSSVGRPNRMDRDVTGEPASRSRGSSERLFFKRFAPWS